ncbi:hypothetical protein A3F55_02820 [Candidatus Adlerbacteria bacterium RIFCSPHIGHO2_12_FULL_53_18]|uniref:DUF4430 domain-containing protein n=1 Tax=Candidatus Adlerbacteria bacterium RIFCSPHIGHO2_12_FULL_53_18 TaxID=1797242 RepID=A0A1F4XT96_9BACT|nr:MAG: hypothetical protein A3F55_02820 [Candidatus Adlerbacteria bacterium RIFCSPHIGHO2_12_FULL_53_18]
MKPIYTLGIIALFVAAIGALGYMPQSSPAEQGEILSQNGLHWHAKVTVRVDGEEVEIPANMGLGAVHNPIHTHDDEPGLVHMEFGGRVTKSDLALQKFFNVWDKNFGTARSMMVNGIESSEFENYRMQDGDVIEISY